MRAVVQTGLGPPSVLQYNTDWPMPVRQPGEALVRVHAAGLNPIEYKIRQGRVPTRKDVPKVLGADMAGVVMEADASSQFKPGDRVFAHAGVPEKGVYKFAGTYADYATVQDDLLVSVPPGVSLLEAAAVPLAGMTAWQAIAPGKLKAGQRILIHAAAGGVGHFAVQIAKSQGLNVTATCSTGNIDFVKGFGADEVIDYTQDKFEDVCKGRPFDAVVDLVGGPVELASLRLTKKDGYFANVFNSGWFEHYKFNNALAVATVLGIVAVQKGLHAIGQGPAYDLVVLKPNAQDLKQLAALMEQGVLRAHIDRLFPLHDARAAHQYMETGRPRGKVVLQMKEE